MEGITKETSNQVSQQIISMDRGGKDGVPQKVTPDGQGGVFQENIDKVTEGKERKGGTEIAPTSLSEDRPKDQGQISVQSGNVVIV